MIVAYILLDPKAIDDPLTMASDKQLFTPTDCGEAYTFFDFISMEQCIITGW